MNKETKQDCADLWNEVQKLIDNPTPNLSEQDQAAEKGLIALWKKTNENNTSLEQKRDEFYKKAERLMIGCYSSHCGF